MSNLHAMYPDFMFEETRSQKVRYWSEFMFAQGMILSFPYYVIFVVRQFVECICREGYDDQGQNFFKGGQVSALSPC